MTLLKKLLVITLFASSFNVVFAEHNSELACPAFPYFRPTTGPLALVNCDFHQFYEQRVAQIIATFGAPNGRPVALNLGGTLVLKYNGKSEKIDINPDAYHEVKIFGHAALATYLILSKSNSTQLNKQDKAELIALENHLQQAYAMLTSLNLSQEATANSTKLATLTLNFLHEVLSNDAVTKQAYDAYFNDIKPLVFESLNIAAKLELDALDNAFKPWLAQMSPEEQKQVGIVVATVHQARAKEISTQYFAKKFGLHFGEGASLENGLVVLEDKFDEASALKLLARHYLDREIAGTMLGDPTKLQSDLLGDAAEVLLQK